MNELDSFEALAAKGRGEQAPAVDVTARVMRAVRTRGRPETLDAPLMVFGGLSLIAASLAAVMAFQAWEAVHDPLAGLFEPVTMVMQ